MRAWLERKAAVPGGRRGKWLVLAAWLIAAMALGSLAGKLGEVQDTSANAFLPRGAESAQVNTELERFRTDEVLPAVVVYSSSTTLTDAARTKAEGDIGAFAKLVAKGEKVVPPLASTDGKALMVVVPLESEDQEVVADKIKEMREVAAANAPPGVDTEVGGPAAGLADAFTVFGELDGTLMMATGTIVIILLLVTYRSPVLWLFPILAVGFSSVLTQAATYLLAKYADLPVDPQSGGVLMVLVFGVGTDYALLLIARYREELHVQEDKHLAMQTALRRSGPAILASAGTIAVGLACLAFADINSSRSMGLVGVVGVLFAFVAMVTALPALLVVCGRWVFWPFVPRFGTPAHKGRTVWGRIGDAVARRPRTAWLGSLAVTAVLAISALGANMGLSQADWFADKPGSVVAQERISAHFPSGAADPAVVIAKKADAAQAQKAAEGTEGVVEVKVAGDSPDGSLTQLSVVLKGTPDSAEAKDAVAALRDGTDALVGGTAAQTLDKENATERDLGVVVPLVLLVVLLVLIWLLKAVVAPVVLLATVVVSYFAAFGASNLLFEHVFEYSGVDWSIPLLGFVFLVALGIDYNIFLMHRVKEEAAVHGHAKGVLTGLSSTGGVITSAGIVLAATFAVFAGLPLVSMAQMGVVVGIGVLLDTFLVRTVLVPALALELGSRFWWPGALSKSGGAPLPAQGRAGDTDRELNRV
ncbi:MMPL family transporter [Streptomyces bambusae]|uniref:MMPL family transporter n=1 Tax=Streptomyces bambusae TaxID=1550616 RepID=UPI001CFE2764|nr:MMPL family transporter [Streptomyces bambusae]MCB5165662.1 MMPL family transporter [Streptomyces bambusae]